MREWSIRNRDRFTLLEPGAPEGGVFLMDPDRAFDPSSTRDWKQAAVTQIGLNLFFFIRRIQSLRVGKHPHLDEVHRFYSRGIDFRMQDSSAGAHALSKAWNDDPMVAGRIFMFQFAVHDPR